MKTEWILSGTIIGIAIWAVVIELLNPEPASAVFLFLALFAVLVFARIEILVMQAQIELLKKINELNHKR